MKGMESAMVTLPVMARLDPRFREDAIQPAHAPAPNKSYDRLDGPLPAFAGTSFARDDKRREQLASPWQKRQITRCDRSCRAQGSVMLMTLSGSTTEPLLFSSPF